MKTYNNKYMTYPDAVNVIEKLQKHGFTANLKECRVELIVSNEEELAKANKLVSPVEFIKCNYYRPSAVALGII